MSFISLSNNFFLFLASVSSNASEVLEHGEGHAEESHHELANLVSIIANALKNSGNLSSYNFLHTYENTIFSLFIIILVSGWIFFTVRRINKSPIKKTLIECPGDKNQNMLEMLVQWLEEYTVEGIGLGDYGRKFAPFIGSLFLFILLNNLLGLIPLFKSPTSSLNTTLALALLVFMVVQVNGLITLGPIGWFLHLAGIEKGGPAIQYPLAILMLPLHIVSELIKPISLSLRLFGNIMGEDMLIAAFIGLGAVSFLIPWQTPFYFLALLTSFIQSLVFTLLACSYIAAFSPHPKHGESDPDKCEV